MRRHVGKRESNWNRMFEKYKKFMGVKTQTLAGGQEGIAFPKIPSQQWESPHGATPSYDAYNLLRPRGEKPRSPAQYQYMLEHWGQEITPELEREWEALR